MKRFAPHVPRSGHDRSLACAPHGDVALPRRRALLLAAAGLVAGAAVLRPSAAHAQVSPVADDSLLRIAPEPGKGFTYPYFLHVPQSLRAQGGRAMILVLPNNTGKLGDDLQLHEADARRRMLPFASAGSPLAKMAEQLGVAVLKPVFPRPESHWKIYTHALDRDVMTTDDAAYRRLDLQLIAMIDDACERLARSGIVAGEQVFLQGFSASGMFANRFVFLHPERVKAAVIGSPGGWPIAPVAEHQGRPLRYPLGVADFAEVAGKPLDLERLRKVPMFLYLGDRDDNDSLTFTDGYEPEDKETAFAVLGTTPVARWDTARALYGSAGLDASFKLYPDTGHTVTKEAIADIVAFLMRHRG